MQLSQSGRVVKLVSVSQGRVFSVNAGESSWTEATNNTGLTPPLNYSGLIYSTACIQKLWFADGTNWCYYNPADNTVNTWAPSAGALPVDSLNNTPRLICTWRGRVVLSGLILDSQNWFMSTVTDPTDFDYSPSSTTPTQAIAGNNAPQGLIGDVVTSLIPYSDDTLFIGGDHSIYRFSGDPMAGGQIDLVSDSIGIAWGIPWCKDPYGNLYFVSNKTGIYTIVPGQQPQRISQAIEQLLLPLNTGENGIRMLWDDRYQGAHVWVTPLDAPAATTHFFYEQRTGAWWTDEFANHDLDPLCCCTFDGNTPGDRAALIGSWDGYVRAVDPTAEDDDGTAIASSVVLGPILTKDMDAILFKDCQAILGEDSEDVSFAIYSGRTAEIALSGEPVCEGTWSAGRNYNNLVRREGHALYIRLSSTKPWAMEQIRVRLASQGKVRRRGR